ncbi:hypothetical protein M440DRAFT_1336032 [Trichoderma longibrachiatum ATCC 18648]|uniref:DUF7514 domain-containing protein n=1 Tax=Trichoderma longibrachiatum ATCC 18648 TaxID=983965 RepID=A0A2T4C0Z1_TRILO|nr:hypothetical protein M440DRAFT_1336032 [Trichoderma longibrachiatum ATCC 18648]
MPTAEATVLHGPLPSAHGNTASPTPRGGDEKMRSLHPSREHHHYQQQQQQRRDSQSSYYREQDKREGRSRRDEDREPARSSPASSSASFPYRDIIKSVLSVMTRSDLSALTSASAPAPSEKNQEKERERERDVKDKERNVEDVVRGLAMEEWNSRWLDELVAKVKGELNDTASDSSISDNGPPTPPLSDTSSKDSMKRYQPTVEDYDDSEDEASSIFERSFAAAAPQEDNNTTAQRKPLIRTSSSLSNASSDSSSSSSSSYSAASRASSSPSPTDKDSVPSPPSSVSSSSPPPRPTVRFADKQPPVIHYIPEPPEPEEPEDERERELERERDREREREHERERERERQYEHEREREPYHDPYQQPPLPSSSSSSSSLSNQRQSPAWTALFNERDEPTPALGRFLRGVANYIIAEYAPIDSLVITPDKLFKFYTRYRLDNEFFPFQRVFDTRYHKSLRGISFLFTDLRCEHHLVQHSIASKPCIPALTPTGFEDWMTLMIRAFPDREARRLDLVLADVPLFSDDRTSSSRSSPSYGQRLPRELPRELFPERGHARAFDLLASSFAEWKSITSVVVPPPEPTSTSSSLPPPSSTSTSTSSSSSSHLHLHPAHTYATSSLIPPSLQKLPPAATKALKEDTRRHKDACYIDQSRIRPSSSLIYPCSSSSLPSSPSSSFTTAGAPLASSSSEAKGAEGIVVSSAASSSGSSSSSSGSSSGSKHRSREREARHRGASERSSRPREPSPAREGRRHHKSRRYRDS